VHCRKYCGIVSVSVLLSRSRKAKGEWRQLQGEGTGSCMPAYSIPTHKGDCWQARSGELKVPGSGHSLRIVRRTEAQLPLCTYLILFAFPFHSGCRIAALQYVSTHVNHTSNKSGGLLSGGLQLAQNGGGDLIPDLRSGEAFKGIR